LLALLPGLPQKLDPALSRHLSLCDGQPTARLTLPAGLALRQRRAGSISKWLAAVPDYSQWG